MDEAAHAVGSRVWMDGGILYKDFVNNKPPLIYAYYSLAQLLFGLGIPSVHFLTALLVVPLTALAVSRFFDHDRRGIYGGIVYLLYSASFLAHDMHSTNAEILMVMPGAWAIVLIRDKQMARSILRMILAGILFGIGFLIKYQIALGFFAVAFACLRMKPRNLQFLHMIAGMVLPITAVILYFAATDALDDFFYWLFWNNLRYSANPISFHEAIGRAMTYLVPFLIITAPLWWFAFQARSFFDPYRRRLRLALLIISIPPLFVGFRFYPHYFIQLYFPLIVAAVPLIEETPWRRWFYTYSIALLLVCTAVNIHLWYGDSKVYRERDPVYQQVTNRLKRDPCRRHASLFVWGYAPAFYYYSGLKPASRFVVMAQAGLTGYVSGNLGSLNKPAQGIPEHWNWLMADLQKNRATYILDTSPAGIYRWNHFPLNQFPRLSEYVVKNFDRLDEVDGVVIYRNCHNSVAEEK
jgi:4-amino-4-deoxy-L-arabinose transferase-like glycosyltransferase